MHISFWKSYGHPALSIGLVSFTFGWHLTNKWFGLLDYGKCHHDGYYLQEWEFATPFCCIYRGL